MGYSLISLKRELSEKKLIENNLLAWGNAKLFGGSGIAAALTNPMVCFGIKNGSLIIIPFTNKNILYNEAKSFSKSSIKDIQYKGEISSFFLSKMLKITFSDGSIAKYTVIQGKGDLKTILTMIQ